MQDLHASIDLETLGTNVDNQILSIGVCLFDLNSYTVQQTFYYKVEVPLYKSISTTKGTIQFWINQAINNPDSLKGLFTTDEEKTISMESALTELADVITSNNVRNVWANSPKFDLAMLEHQYKIYDIRVPWQFSDDRCMRTLRFLAHELFYTPVNVDFEGTYHNAMDDAIWQSHYIMNVIKKLREK